MPKKRADLITHSRSPLNLETPAGLLAGTPSTPNEAFYVRNHGSLPEIQPAAYKLTVSGLVEDRLDLSLDELRERFAYTTVEAALQCAGNRRDELAEVAPIPGELLWGPGAVGNARWGGVSLADVLGAAGVEERARHVEFVGSDEIEEGDSAHFGGSIPLHKALSPEVLLAYEMNGEPLPAEHGFPLRVVVPGYIGARSVKWLDGISLRESPSENHFQAHSYRLFPPYVTAEADSSRAMPLGEISVNATICEPKDGARLPAGAVRVRGVALAGGGRTVERVDLTADGGRTWTGAELSQSGPDAPWAWRTWEAELDLDPGEWHLAARALDSAADIQPEDAASLWNLKGYANNSWHGVRISLL